MPLAIDSYGRLGRGTSRFSSDLGDIASDMLDRRVYKAMYVQVVRQELSCAFYHGNVGVNFESTASIAQAVGRQVMPVVIAQLTRVGRCWPSPHSSELDLLLSLP